MLFFGQIRRSDNIHPNSELHYLKAFCGVHYVRRFFFPPLVVAMCVQVRAVPKAMFSFILVWNREHKLLTVLVCNKICVHRLTIRYNSWKKLLQVIGNCYRNRKSSDNNSIFKQLKCPYDQIFDIHCFYIFVHSTSSQDILPNFNLLRSIESTFFGPLFIWIYGRH